jgi:hypothetical protein
MVKKQAVTPKRDRRADAETAFELMRIGLSARKSCAKAGFTLSALNQWCDADETIALQYTRARGDLLDWQAQDLERIGEQAALAESAVEVAGLRLQSDNRKWLLSKLAPKKYGEKLELSGDANAPLVVKHMTDEQLEVIAASSSR